MPGSKRLDPVGVPCDPVWQVKQTEVARPQLQCFPYAWFVFSFVYLIALCSFVVDWLELRLAPAVVFPRKLRLFFLW
jgi:hypothetical protein